MSSSVAQLGVDKSICGSALSTSQRVAVLASLRRLAVNESLANVQFWGKISGSERDYLLAQAVTVKHAIAKSYYFSNDNGVTFSKLPGVDAWLREQCGRVRGMFVGNPSRKYKDGRIYTQEEEEEETAKDEEEEEAAKEEAARLAEQQAEEEANGGGAAIEHKEEKKVPARRVTEVDRLAYVVESIEHATALLPRGAYYLTATGAIVANPSYTGLSLDDAKKLASYQLFRTPESPLTLARVRAAGVANNSDFLDTLADLKATHEWSLQVDESGTAVTLRSLVWLGFECRVSISGGGAGAAATAVGAHVHHTTGYFGYGDRNVDLPFMH